VLCPAPNPCGSSCMLSVSSIFKNSLKAAPVSLFFQPSNHNQHPVVPSFTFSEAIKYSLPRIYILQSGSLGKSSLNSLNLIHSGQGGLDVD
jgi:hypothetical protein